MGPRQIGRSIGVCLRRRKTPTIWYNENMTAHASNDMTTRQGATAPDHEGQEGQTGFGRIALAFLIGPAVVLVWMGLTALVYVLFEPGETVMVLGPQHKTLSAVADSDARVLSTGEGFIVARSDRPGYVRQLYKNGAWLVLPATEMMCGHPGAVRKIATGK